MKLKYDNLEDAKTKLLGTYCMYDGKAIAIKFVSPVEDEHGHWVNNQYAIQGNYLYNGRTVGCSIDDPKFNCSDFNVGYINNTNAAAWFYRVPMKQYKQGLRADQVRRKCSNVAFREVAFQGKPVCSMLENSYPSFQNAAELVKSGEAVIMAFHKNFAMTLDRIHNDLLLEYKGVNIGCTSNLKDFELLEEHLHLLESLKEAVG